MDIKGHTVGTVMIAAGAKIAEEYYFSVLLDRANRTYLAMCSVEGGVEIEQLAVERPEALARVAVDPNVGIDDAKAAEIVDAAGFPEADKAAIAGVIKALWTVYREEDATLVEVNPLVKTEDGEIIALDGKVSLDANADFRHPDHEELEDKAAADPLEAAGQGEEPQLRQASRATSASSATAPAWSCRPSTSSPTPVRASGAKPANFLDIGGGASAEVMTDGLHLILSDPNVKAVFVNVFGGITACDAVANGIVEALKRLGCRGGPSARRPARRQQRRGGPPHPRRVRPPQRHHRADDGRRRPQGRRARRREVTPRRDRTRTPTPWQSFSTRTARSSSRA